MLNNGNYLSFIRTEDGEVKFLGNQKPANLLLGTMVILAITTLTRNHAPGINYRQGLIQNGHHGIIVMVLPEKNVFRFHYGHPKKKKIHLL